MNIHPSWHSTEENPGHAELRRAIRRFQSEFGRDPVFKDPDDMAWFDRLLPKEEWYRLVRDYAISEFVAALDLFEHRFGREPNLGSLADLRWVRRQITRAVWWEVIEGFLQEQSQPSAETGPAQGRMEPWGIAPDGTHLYAQRPDPRCTRGHMTEDEAREYFHLLDRLLNETDPLPPAA